MSPSGDGSEPVPTYAVYGLAVVGLVEFGGQFRQTLSDPERLPLALACAAFLAGSAVFPLAPLLLLLRMRRGLHWLGWATAALLLSPWLLLVVTERRGGDSRFLYGYYLFASAFTTAFVVIWLPLEDAAAHAASNEPTE